MGITKFKVKLWNRNNKVAVEPVEFYTFWSALWYILKYYYKSKHEKINFMTNFEIERVQLG